MKRSMALLIILTMIFINSMTANAEAADNIDDFSAMFDEHGSVMLVIEPQSGSIIYANHAAASYYGYTKEQLLNMKITQINTLSPEETEKEMQAAMLESRNYFEFKHLLANGEIRNVEVFSYPVRYEGREVLLSIVHDITAKTHLEEKEQKMIVGIIISGAIVIAILLLLFSIMIRSNKKLRITNHKLDNFNELRKTFIDADNSIVYLKDENLKYVFVNRATEEFYHKSAEEIMGCDDYELSDIEFADKV